MSRKPTARGVESHVKDPRKRKRLLLLAGLAALVLIFVWSPTQDSPDDAASVKVGCSPTLEDVPGFVQRLVDNAGDCIAELRSGSPLGAEGSYLRAFVLYDGTTYKMLGDPTSDPTVQGYGAKAVSYGETQVVLEILNHDKVVYQSTLNRGEQGMFVVDYADLPGADVLRFTDGQAGRHTIEA